MSKSAWLILGNQLFEEHPALQDDKPIIMIEASDLCGRFTYHKHKLVLLLSSMRSFKDHAEASGVHVHYTPWKTDSVFAAELRRQLDELGITELHMVRAADMRARKNIGRIDSITLHEHESPYFMTPPEAFDEWYNSQKSPLMESFYRWQRKRLDILMEDGKPLGGSWNYDDQNREPFPKDIVIPALNTPEQTTHTQEVIELINGAYADNPGDGKSFWLPTTHAQASNWLDAFLAERFNLFGAYEDAMKAGEAFGFHSTLSPLINIGLLTPKQVIDRALEAHVQHDIPLNSVEGFVRQIIGWREYMYGLYERTPELMEANFFGFVKELEDWWYTTDFREQDLPPPVMGALETVHSYGYNHHIERLMVLGNWFLLNEYNPQSVYRWFSSMYVDAYDWVMIPNVQGMSQYADGGIVATKPYISGGNYLQKMGSWWPSMNAARESEFNDLYWAFLYNHRKKLKDNHRLSIVLKQAEKQHAKRNQAV